MTGRISFRIERIVKNVNNISVFVLDPLQPEPFEYKAGQFLTIILSLHGKELRRSYSFCTVYGIDPMPAIAIQRVENGEVSRYILDVWKEGDIINALPPAGLFTLDEVSHSRSVYFIAAGSGITPLYSLLNYSLRYQPSNDVTLFYSNRSGAATLFYEELNALQKQYSFNLEFFFSESKYLDKARLTKENLTRLINETLQFRKEDALFFLCGPYEFMQMCEITLRSMGFHSNAIRREIFITNDQLPPKTVLPESPARHVTLIWDDVQYPLMVPYNKSILDVAIEEKIPVPYSCKSGRCGTCAGYCESGKVFMTYNEVLTGKDEESGRVLTCTAHPLDDSVVISFP